MSASIVVVSGPSGVGKGTVIRRFQKIVTHTVDIISYTTRLPRPSETDGVEYRFVTKDQFDKLNEAGEFLEAEPVLGNWYATPLGDVVRAVEAGKIAVLEIDWKGAKKVKARFPEAMSVMILPPDVQSLRDRLVGRESETPEIIERRLADAPEVLAQKDWFDVRIVNIDAQQAAEELAEAVRNWDYHG